jgi:hypothetical protein
MYILYVGYTFFNIAYLGWNIPCGFCLTGDSWPENRSRVRPFSAVIKEIHLCIDPNEPHGRTPVDSADVPIVIPTSRVPSR